MKCTEFQNQIDDYCDGELNVELVDSSEMHLASCPECTKLVAEHRHMLASLKAMPVVGPSDGFANRALQTAKAADINHHHRRGFMVGFGSAAVAGLALWVVVGMNTQMLPGSGNNIEATNPEMAKVNTKGENNIPEFSIALNEQRDIKLAFYSAEKLEGAKITLMMPESVALVGYKGQRELSWKTNLARGNNLLRLPVMATSSRGGQMVAHIEYMGKVKTLRVNLAIGNATKSVPGVSGGTVPNMRDEVRVG